MKNIVLLGAPGSGKGTQAAFIAKEYGIPHIPTGDIFRKNISEHTALGDLAKSYMDKGLLVPDEVVIGSVESRLKESDCGNGYILDGFPRTIAQAEALDKVTKIDVALNFIVPFDVIIERLSDRRVCVCGATYSAKMLNGETKCSKCGKEVFQRDDDKAETVKARLDVYSKQTEPLIGYYTSKGIIADIKVSTIEGTFEDVKKVIGK